jgi:hypothetical protein
MFNELKEAAGVEGTMKYGKMRWILKRGAFSDSFFFTLSSFPFH